MQGISSEANFGCGRKLKSLQNCLLRITIYLELEIGLTKTSLLLKISAFVMFALLYFRCHSCYSYFQFLSIILLCTTDLIFNNKITIFSQFWNHIYCWNLKKLLVTFFAARKTPSYIFLRQEKRLVTYFALKLLSMLVKF